MLWKKGSYIAALAMVAGVAGAQFDGPAPLAWRWQQSNAVAPTGAPLVDGNTLYYNAGTRMFAIDRESGNTLWKFPNVEPLQGFLKKSPIFVSGVLVVATDDRKVFGVNPSDGTLKWVYEAPLPLSSAPVAAGKFVAFAMEGGSVMAVSADTGMAIYDAAHKVPGSISGPLSSNGTDTIYFFNDKSQLTALNVASKKASWQQNFGLKPADGVTVFSNGNLYLYTGTYLACLNTLTGSARWQAILSEPMAFSPEVGGGTVACVSRTGKVYFFDEAGRLRNRVPASVGSQPATAPTFAGGKFIISTSNGALNLVDPFGVGTLWQYFIRPMNEVAAQATTGGGAGASGAGGAGGLGGGAGAGGLGGGGQTTPQNVTLVSLPAATKGVIAGKTLLIPSVDGSLLAFDIENGVDLTPPEVKPVWPPQGELVSGLNGQEFLFRIDDDASGVNPATIKFDVDGKPYNFDFGRDGFLICRISTTQRNAPLINGRRTLNLSAKDWLGNEVKKSFSVRIDNSLAIQQRGKAPGTTGGGAGNKGGGGGFSGGDGAG